MTLRQSYPLRCQPPRFDHQTHIRQANQTNLVKAVEIMQRTLAIRQKSTSQLRHDIRVNAELVIDNQAFQLCFEAATAEHLNPDGRVCKNHCSSTRNLRTSSIFGADPASASSRRPASRAIKDFSASRNNSARSVRPVYS